MIYILHTMLTNKLFHIFKQHYSLMCGFEQIGWLNDSVSFKNAIVLPLN